MPRVEDMLVQQHNSVTRHATWRRPMEGVIKISIDASVKEGVGSLGMVARDANKEVMGVAASYPIRVISPLLGEASSLRWILAFVRCVLKQIVSNSMRGGQREHQGYLI